MQRVRPLSVAPLIVSMFALVVALGGVSYAAVQLANNSVGTAQLKKNAVIGSKVKDGSLTAADFATGQLPQGPAGPTGAPGPQGPAGPSILIAGEFGSASTAIFLKTVNFTVSTPDGAPVVGSPAMWLVTMPAGTVVPGSGKCGIPTLGTVFGDIPSLYVGQNICDGTSARFEIKTDSYPSGGAYITFNYVIANLTNP